jgi:hypothetical protein
MSFLRSRMRTHSGMGSKRGGGLLFIGSTEILPLRCQVTGFGRAPALTSDLNFKSQRSEGDWPKLAWGLAKAGPFLRWPA